MNKLFLMLFLAIPGISGATGLEPLGNPAVDPAEHALVHVIPDVPSVSVVKTVELEKAKVIFTSTEASAWHVLQVYGPSCEESKGKKSADIKKCKEIKAECKAATKFAVKVKAPVACTGLYSQAMVEITTAKAPHGSHASSAEAARVKTRKASNTKKNVSDEELPPK